MRKFTIDLEELSDSIFYKMERMYPVKDHVIVIEAENIQDATERIFEGLRTFIQARLKEVKITDNKGGM